MENWHFIAEKSHSQYADDKVLESISYIELPVFTLSHQESARNTGNTMAKKEMDEQ